MAGLLQRNFHRQFRKRHLFLLAFIWLTGLLCGVGLSGLAGDSYFSLMRSASTCPVSIVSLLSISLLPFLLSGFYVYLHSFGFLAGLCFIKGCLFAFVSMGLFLSYDSAGWLLRLLMMFSDLCCLVPLWRCWVQLLFRSDRGSLKPVFLGSLLAAGIVSLDYLYVLPLLAKLVEY